MSRNPFPDDELTRLDITISIVYPVSLQAPDAAQSSSGGEDYLDELGPNAVTVSDVYAAFYRQIDIALAKVLGPKPSAN